MMLRKMRGARGQAASAPSSVPSAKAIKVAVPSSPIVQGSA